MRSLYAASIVAAGILLVGCSGGPAAITTHGSMQVLEDCNAAGIDYSDVSQGAQVVVTNSSGTVVGTGQLGNAKQSDTSGLDFDAICNYSFTVQVPGGLPRYGITVSHRGTIWFSAKQMQDGPGLTLGGDS